MKRFLRYGSFGRNRFIPFDFARSSIVKSLPFFGPFLCRLFILIRFTRVAFELKIKRNGDKEIMVRRKAFIFRVALRYRGQQKNSYSPPFLGEEPFAITPITKENEGKSRCAFIGSLFILFLFFLDSQWPFIVAKQRIEKEREWRKREPIKAAQRDSSSFMSSPFILFAQRGHSHKIKGEAMKEKESFYVAYFSLAVLVGHGLAVAAKPKPWANEKHKKPRKNH